MRQYLKSGAAAIALMSLSGAMMPVYAQESDENDGGENTFLHPYRGDINPFYGDINPFYGDINPFRGDINPFYGDISPFWGDINPFWGDINPFGGDINPFFSGDINPFWGDINPFFSDDINPFWSDINPFWQDVGPVWGDLNIEWNEAAAEGGDFTTIANDMASVIDRAESVFGAAIEARTGQSMDEAFLNALLGRFGIDLDDPDSLASVSVGQRSEFFLTFYDSLMGFSGVDHVDHWMPAINWSPAMAASYDWGRAPLVGVLDFSVNTVDGSSFRGQGGERDYLNVNHGNAVASLIGAPVDGVGVMGVAPHAAMRFYNPFDESHTAGWDDVAAGVESLANGGTSIINMSLGVPGWTLHQEWAEVFRQDRVARHADDLTFVIAAGNDGVTQTVDLDWTGVSVLDNLLLVGSVDPNGNISSFSNTPGEACLLTNGVCETGSRLMDRFLVAPGELLLVDDGEGGVTRVSGTSFAAPLVSGAAALVKGWWHWLDGSEVADVLLLSARDLGEPGVDAVYGHGMLDVAGAMSPLDAANLYGLDKHSNPVEAAELIITGGRLSLRHSNNHYVTVFEDIGDSYRDFTIAVDDLIVGSSLSESVANAYAEQYIYERTGAPLNGTSFSDISSASRVLSRRGNMMVTATASTLDPSNVGYARDLGFHAGVELSDTESGRSMKFGVGEGALALSSQTGFNLFSDHRPESGGVNPVLGFASGGAYAASTFNMDSDLQVSFGITTTHEQALYVMPGTGEERALFEGVAPYQAFAANLDLSYPLSDRVTVNGSLTQLHEASGLLGAQGSSILALEGGADTTALTFGLDARPSSRISLSASMTMAQTRTTAFDGGLLDIADRIDSTAAQVSIRYEALFSNNDGVRFSMVQPLHIERGALSYTGMAVTDRETGELAVESDVWELGGRRPVYAEVIYVTELGSSDRRVSLFSRQQLSGDEQVSEFSAATSGVRFEMRF
ncbi:S8 family peptidase [Maricaulis sp.]|uniref:S8 family peptidase n=1 Tax=Maricaulis sp. TaxID=1486257 RepID=UPI0026022F8B|nr:S8 family peptidase [Maricaulis sp.]MDF1770033.1 S8 family serine peptidase [Maricaulis sp.]